MRLSEDARSADISEFRKLRSAKPFWRSWLEASALAAAFVAGVPHFASAQDLAPPARFLSAPDAQPLAAPTPAVQVKLPASQMEGPSLGNEWTAAGRKPGQPARTSPQAEHVVNHTTPSTLKPTNGSLAWRPRDATMGRAQSVPPAEISPPSHSIKVGAWDDAKPLAKPSIPRDSVEVAQTPLVDPLGDRGSTRGVTPKTSSKLELPSFPASKSVLAEEPASEPEIDPAPVPAAPASRQPRGVVKFQPRAAAPAPYAPIPDDADEGPVRNIWEGSNCDKDNKACQSYIKIAQGNQLTRYTKAFLDISPNAPSEDRQDVPISKKADILAKMEDRVWTNRQGQKVAEGRWVDLIHGKVVIKGAMSRTIPMHELSDDDQCLVSLAWILPSECDPHYGTYNGRDFMCSTFTWKASALCHKPLYFEAVQLERYGHTSGPLLEPFMSGAHFFVNIAILPYKMGINPPGECQYALGYYRPGSCAPWMVPPFPISLRGAALQTGAVFGVHAMMP